MAYRKDATRVSLINRDNYGIGMQENGEEGK